VQTGRAPDCGWSSTVKNQPWINEQKKYAKTIKSWQQV
jgi:hypothetical protein